MFTVKSLTLNNWTHQEFTHFHDRNTTCGRISAELNKLTWLTSGGKDGKRLKASEQLTQTLVLTHRTSRTFQEHSGFSATVHHREHGTSFTVAEQLRFRILDHFSRSWKLVQWVYKLSFKTRIILFSYFYNCILFWKYTNLWLYLVSWADARFDCALVIFTF